MRMRVLLAALLVTTIVGCGGEKKKTIGYSALTLNNPFFGIIGDNLKAEAAKYGYDTIIVSGDMDPTKQLNQVNDFISKECVAIVLCPCDSKSGSAIKKANEAGIPVFTTDLACLAAGVKVECHIATDNLGGGRLAGEAMIEALGEAGGEVVIIDYKKAESCMLRVKGFREVIDKHNAGRATGRIEIVAELEGEGATDAGFKAAADAIESHPNMRGIFAINDPSALGARGALEKAKLQDQVVIIGFDGQREGKEAIRDGKIYADPIQFPDKMGILTAQKIDAYFKGEKIEKEILIDTQLYRKADGQSDPDLN